MIRIDLGKGGMGGSANKPKGFLSFNLPPALRDRLQKAQVTGTTLIIMGLSLALACLFPLFSSQYQRAIEKTHADEMKQIDKRMVEVSQQIETYTPFKRELQSYEEQKKLVSDRLAVVRRLLDQRNAPINTLDAVAQSLPQRVWLQSIDLSLEGSPNLNLSGTSYSNEEISDFVDSLSRSVYLSGVTLEDVASKADAAAKIEVNGFTLTAQPKGKDGALPVAVAPVPKPAAVQAAPAAPMAAPPAPVQQMAAVPALSAAPVQAQAVTAPMGSPASQPPTRAVAQELRP